MKWKEMASSVLPRVSHPKGDLLAYWISHAEMLRWLNAFFVLCLIFQTAGWYLSLKKPPIVIRVDQVGNASAIADLSANNLPSDVEIIAFSKDFLRSYIEVNSLTVQKDLARALNMMSRRFQSAHLRELKQEDFLGKIIRANIHSELEIKQINITSKLTSRAEIDVRGITATSPLEDNHAPPSRQGFIAKLTLLYVDRTDKTPNGLVVEDYRSETVPLQELLESEKVLPKEPNT